MKSADFKKTKIAIEFKTIPTRITAVEKSWFRDIIVDKDLRSKCFKPNNISSKECEQYHFFNNNIEDIKEECSRKDNNIDNFEKNCMLEDFFRENILYFN